MKKIILPLVLVQIIVAVFLGAKIYKQKTNVLGNVSYSPIQKDNIVPNPDSELKFFYEPNANVIETNTIPLTSSLAYYTLNSDHLNERYEYSTEKPANTCRIITLGDSFTFGQYVDTAQNYPERLESLLRESVHGSQKVEVINLGVGGYDIQYAVERYLLRGKKYNPDIILWLLKNDDFFDIREFTLERAENYYLEMGSEKMDQLSQVGSYPHQTKASEELLDVYGSNNLIDYQKEQIEKLISNFNGNIIFLVYGDTDRRNQYAIRRFVEEYPDKVFSLVLPKFYTDYPEAELPDGHPSTLGHKIIAKLVSNYLLEESFVPCN